MKHWIFVAISLLFSQASFAERRTPPLSLRVEGGASTTGYNYFKIPNTSASTRVDLPEGDWIGTYRIYALVPVSERWILRFLYAPLKLNYGYESASATVFRGTTFTANTPLTVGYQFNSYRASIIRYFDLAADSSWHLGFSAKIRDAFIQVSDGTTTARKDDLGFVPLVNVGLDYSFAPAWSLAFDLDGLAGGPGRAFDGRLEVQYQASPQVQVGLGYRFVEGGADVDEVNNFALFHTVSGSVSYLFF